MAVSITPAMRTDVSELYVAMFGRAPDSEGLGYWVQQLAAGQSLTSVADTMFATAPAREFYPSWMSNAEIIESFYENVLGRAGDAEGLAYWTAQLNAAGATPGSVIASMVNVVSNYSGSDPAGIQSAALFNNRVEVAQYYAEQGGSIAGAAAVIAGVTADPASVDAAIAAINAPVTGAFNLTVNQDTLTGGQGDDNFNAFIFDNQNTFQSGDVLVGGAGTDTLRAEIGLSQKFAITAKTSSVENMFFRAQAQATDSSDNAVSGGATISIDIPSDSPLFAGSSIVVNDSLAYLSYGHSKDGHSTIDAQDFGGVRQLWSEDSRANLVIEDVRVNSHETTIGWRNADAGNVNYEVYFDNQHITAPGAFDEGSALFLQLMDLDGAASGNYLLNNPYSGFTFTLDGVSYRVESDAIDDAQTYAALAAAINAALDTNPALAGLDAALGLPFTATDASGVPFTGTTIDIINSGSGELGVGGWVTPDGVMPPDLNLFATQSVEPPETIVPLTQVDIIVDNLGRDCLTSDLIVGAMGLCDGIQQFNVQVDRDSYMGTMASTANALEVIIVENIADNNEDGDGNLTVGTLEDIQIFDASAMVGDVDVSINLSGDITPKFLNLEDTQDNPAADNVPFEVTTGSGDDSVEMAISAMNLANNFFIDDVGTTTREDMNLTIATGTGNDYVQLSIYDGWDMERKQSGNANSEFWNEELDLAVAAPNSNWYVNSALNANLNISTGEGDDTVWTPGSGNKKIDLGSGNDAVYVDNTGTYPITGRMATWTFNAEDDNLQNLESGVNDSYNTFKSTLTVSFLGFSKTVDLPNTNGKTTDLQVNQAIKNAINNDPVLSKLAVAEDGPANTLVVRSLVDGDMQDGYLTQADLTVKVNAPTDLTDADVAQLNAWYGVANEATHLATINGGVVALNNSDDYNADWAQFFGGAPYYGEDSEHTADNEINAGTGNDVVVLGTGYYSNDTVVYTGYANGTDAIVNFDDEYDPASSYYQGVSAVREVITVTFSASDGDPAAQTIVFDGDTVTLSAPATQGVIPATDIALQFYQNFGSANWSVAGLNGSTVTLQRTALGATTDVVPADFTGTYFGAGNGNGSVSVVTTQQGVDAATVGTKSNFTVTFDIAGTAADAAGSFTFNGTTVAYAEGDGALSLANKLAAASFADWTVGPAVVTTGQVSVTFNAKLEGATAIGTAADFDIGTNVIVGGVAGTVGNANVGNVVLVNEPAGPSAGTDYLDFSAYNAAGVTVNGVLIEGSVPATNGTYITLTESLTNAGEYTIREVKAGATAAPGDDVVTVIGVADFGETKAFSDVHFIL